MDMQEVNKLIQTFAEYGLTCLELEEGDSRISIKKEWFSGEDQESAFARRKGGQRSDGKRRAAGKMTDIFDGKTNTAERPSPLDSNKNEEAQEGQTEATIVKAPLVGMFYTSSSPEEEPFVQVGDFVKKGQVIGIIEAMKLMNEVTSELDGVVSAVLAENGQVVEYGQPLFEIR